MTHFLRDSKRKTFILFLIIGAEKSAWFSYAFALYIVHSSFDYVTIFWCPFGTVSIDVT